MTITQNPPPQWSRRRAEKQRRLDRVRHLADGVVLPTDRIVEALELLLAPGDRVVLEGNNQKQADFLSRSLAKVDPGRLHDLPGWPWRKKVSAFASGCGQSAAVT